MHNLIHRLASFSLLAALSSACVEKGGESTDDSTGGSSGDSTGATTDDSTGDSTGGPTEATTGDSTDTGTDEGTTVEPTTGEPTTGEPGALCQAFAEWSVMCGEAEPGGEAELALECEEERAFIDVLLGPECGVKYDAYTACAAMNPCNDEAACAVELAAAENCEPEAGATCKAYAANVIACEPGPDEPEIATSCQFEVNAGLFDSPACAAAVEALYGCFAGLDCTALFDGAGCEAEVMMQETACVTSEDGAPARPGARERWMARR